MSCLLKVSIYMYTSDTYVCSFGGSSCLVSEALRVKLLLWEACFNKECRQQNGKNLSCHISFLAGDEQRAWSKKTQCSRLPIPLNSNLKGFCCCSCLRLYIIWVLIGNHVLGDYLSLCSCYSLVRPFPHEALME